MKRLRMAVWILCMVALAGSTGAQPTADSEETVVSTLFFKLPLFVYRPDDPRFLPLSVCLLGSEPFHTHFARLAQAPVDGRPVSYRRLSATSDATPCHYLFISTSHAPHFNQILHTLVNSPTVTVSDMPGFAQAGGMVELSRSTPGSPIGVLINRNAARHQDIGFNAQLLRLARVVP